jgi:hypothetical protein
MLSLAFERTHKVLLVQFSGIMTSEDLHSLDTEVVAFLKKEGPAQGFIIDCSSVEDFKVPTAEFVRRGQRTSMVDEIDRVYVMPSADLYGMGRLFGTYQRISGKREPLIVKTLVEAFTALNLTDPRFEPV